jgi:hypothetical protein
VELYPTKKTPAFGKCFLVMCPRLDSNQHAHSAQPPQDCMSTNFTTWAWGANLVKSFTGNLVLNVLNGIFVNFVKEGNSIN